MKNKILFGILFAAIAAVGAAALTTALDNVIHIAFAEKQGQNQGDVVLLDKKPGNKGPPGREGNSGP